MSILTRAVIRCDEPMCGLTITFEGARNVTAKDAVQIATDQYGWAVSTKSQRCFDHRKRALRFHDIKPSMRYGGVYPLCDVCDLFDTAESPRRPQHCEAQVRANAAKLREQHFVTWSRS